MEPNHLKLFKRNMIIIVANPNNNFGVLFDYLRGFGFDVIIVDDAETALPMVEYIVPDIVLIDVVLPGMDGFEMCRELKNYDPIKHIPIVFIATESDPIDKMRGFSLGAVDYITKPIQSEEVLTRLKTHLTVQNLKSNLEENNRRLQEEVIERESLIEELDSFAHTVAHDLKNPLGVTISYAQFLSGYSNQLSKQQLKQYADVIYENGQRMTNIINELLLLASARKEDVEPQPLDMAEVVEEVEARLAYIIEEFMADVIVPDHWPVALGYGPWVAEIWANYVSNAIKYGGHPPRVELGAVVEGNGMIQFRVWDNGKGLSVEEQGKLFKEFSRLDNTGEKEGHGLGLSIVQRITKKLGGTVGVMSDNIPGQGCVFYFTLPAYKETDNRETG